MGTRIIYEFLGRVRFPRYSEMNSSSQSPSLSADLYRVFFILKLRVAVKQQLNSIRNIWSWAKLTECNFDAF